MSQSPNSDSLLQLESAYRHAVAHGNFAERAAAHRNLYLLKNDYYTSDELIDIASHQKFVLSDPFTCIRRGTRIESGAKILDGTVIDGESVVIGNCAILDHAVIRGSRVTIGEHTHVFGHIEVNNLCIGEHNEILNIKGLNRGEIVIGCRNTIGDLRICNESHEKIIIGNSNRLYDGLRLNIPFEAGRIWIGNQNELGRDGGGVISCSYRFGERWWGHVIIGTGVETTRGAEVLGFSLIGWPLITLQKITNQEEDWLVHLFTHGSLDSISALLERISDKAPGDLNDDTSNLQTASLFGVVKVKRCCLVNRVRIKDDTRVQAGYLRDVEIQERCVISHSALVPPIGTRFDLPLQDLSFAEVTVRTKQDWKHFLGNIPSEEYGSDEASFYSQ